MKAVSARRARHRRGTIYVAVLGVAIILTIIGMMSVTLVRIDRHVATTQFDLAEAAILAQSAIEMAALDIANDTSWRSNHTHDDWETARTLGNGSFKWKLVADSEDLLAPSDGAVKIVGQGAVNDAVQEYSVYIVDATPAELDAGTWAIE